MTGLNARVTNGTRAVGELPGLSIRGAVNPPWTLRDAGYDGASAEYAVDVECRGEHLRESFRVSTVPSTTLVPVSR